MEKVFDISSFVATETPESVKKALAERFRSRRRELKLSQKELALRSDVSYGSLRRFEKSGDVSLASLLKLSYKTGYLNDFSFLFSNPAIKDLKDFK
jgi:transcriptional regulator with XRE-family HTH domain